MDYGISTIDGGVTDKYTCTRCGHQHHHVYGDIRYAYMFLESLPWFPTDRSVRVECKQCFNNVPRKGVNDRHYAAFAQHLFSFKYLWHKYLGMAVMVMLFAWGIFHVNQKDEQSIAYLSQPKINDFYHLDYRHFATDVRPHQNYKLAKVVDVTGDVVSVVFGSFAYRYQSTVKDAVRIGHVRNFSYFETTKRHYSIADLNRLFQQGAIYQVGRPEGNILYGSYIYDQPRQSRRGSYMPGKRQYQQGIAFIEASYIEGHYSRAKELLTTSAEMGYIDGQISLAELYLSGNIGKIDIERALYWLEQAAKQSSQRAVDKYRALCQRSADCNVSTFYQRLNEAGVVFSVNL